MSRKRIIITAAAGLASFAGAFILAWFTKTTEVSQSDQLNRPTSAGQKTELKLPSTQLQGSTTIGIDATIDNKIKKAMTEKQLKNLIYEVREKMQEYNDKLKGLEVREQRLQMAQDALKKDIENLNNLRVELASIVASVKSEQDKLLTSRIEIAQAEKVNLASIAATYDKMDAGSAGEILTNMCKSQVQVGTVVTEGSGFDDAVKILHYMTERTKAKLLAELVTSEPKLAAVLCQRLKQIAEGK